MCSADILKIKAEVYAAHPISEHVHISHVPEYQDKPWNNAELYKKFLDEDYARLRTLRRREADGKKVLVHIKAQHMLYPDGTPGPELLARLHEALTLANTLNFSGYRVTFVVSGAIHAGCNHTTLADACASWLYQHGVKHDEIVRHTELKNGSHEDYLVAEMMDADTEISQCHVICSLGQVARSALCFIDKGWLPDFHPVTYLGMDTARFDGSEDAMMLDAARAHQSLIAELRGEGFGIEPFFKGADALRASEEAATKRHEDEIKAAAQYEEEIKAETAKALAGLDDPSQYCSMER